VLSWLLSKFRRKGAPVEVWVHVERRGTGPLRYEARPVVMRVRGKEIGFGAGDFLAYGRTRRSARRGCLKKALAYLEERDGLPGE
jgi:hypothetical protein